MHRVHLVHHIKISFSAGDLFLFDSFEQKKPAAEALSVTVSTNVPFLINTLHGIPALISRWD